MKIPVLAGVFFMSVHVGPWMIVKCLFAIIPGVRGEWNSMKVQGGFNG